MAGPNKNSIKFDDDELSNIDFDSNIKTGSKNKINNTQEDEEALEEDENDVDMFSTSEDDYFGNENEENGEESEEDSEEDSEEGSESDASEDDENNSEDADNTNEDASIADDFGVTVGADEIGISGNGEDEYDVADQNANFLNQNGDLVVMDTSIPGDNFKLEYIDIEKIAIVKRIRTGKNVEDLIKSVRSTGLLMPVVVAPTATEGIYVLINGYRRLLACAQVGIRKVPCIVNTKINTPEIPILESMYNHSKPYTMREIVDYIDYLEKEKHILSASMIEYLLQMESGDYTKLKDILNDNDDDIVSKMMSGMLSISQAFKKLEQRRKNESREEKDLKKAEHVYQDSNESGADQIEDSGETSDGGPGLTEDEIKSLAINANDLDDGLENASLTDMVQEGEQIDGFKPHKQDPNEREKLDPALRKAVLARDNNTCQICKEISGQEYIEVLDVHHIQEVYLGGDDSIGNLITGCTCCHKLVHLYGRGELYIRPLEEMSEKEQAKFKRIVKLGTIIRKGMALKGMKKEQLKKIDNAHTIGRTKPGTGQVAG